MDGGAGNAHRLRDGVHRRNPTKKTKQLSKKNKPIKVVYISNPMKVQTSAAEFMALVQELTGQDADFPDPSKFPSAAVCGGSVDNTVADGGDGDHLLKSSNSLSSLTDVEPPAEDDLFRSFYDEFDDLIFPPPVIGSFSGLLPAAVFYESYAR